MPSRDVKPKTAKMPVRKKEMRMYWLAYNVALEPDVMRLLERLQITAYSRWDEVKGSGRSGSHLNDDIWPGVNNLIMFVAAADLTTNLRQGVKSIRERFPGEGIKLMVQPCLEME